MNLRYFLLALIPLNIWGFAYSFSKLGLREFPPLLLTALSFTLASLLLVPFFRISKEHISKIYLLSIVRGIGAIGFITLAQQEIDASTGCILEQLNAPIAIIMALFFFNDRMEWYKWLGLGVAFSGAVIIAGEPSMPRLLPFFLMIFAASSLALGSIIVKKMSSINPLALNGYMALFAAPQLFLLSFIFESGQMEAIAGAGLYGWGAVAYRGILNFFVAVSIWFYLLGKCKISVLAPLNLISPVSALLGGILIHNEEVSWQKALGGILVISGIIIIQFLEHRDKKKSAKYNHLSHSKHSDPAPS